jgi:aspartyl-tRNA(Asn)/glutamyl-tRNA(Gln) amidotransferase subunit C
MQVSKEQLLHIANLARLNLKEDEVDNYLENLQEILTFAEQVNSASTDGLDETIGANDNYNVFRKDEVVAFEDTEALLQNAASKERGMFKIPKVIQ